MPQQFHGAVRVSGQKIYAEIQSGQPLYVRVSGYTVPISGQKLYTENQSGQALSVRISGYTNLLSGIFIDGVSGQKVYAENQSGQAFYVRISGYTVPVSGQKVYVETQSGQAVYVQFSGLGNAAQLSGQVVHIAGTDISGLITPILTTTSGHLKYDVPTRVTTAGIQEVTDLSGGQVLGGANEVVAVEIEALSGTVYIGGTGASDMPVHVSGQRGLSSVGFLLVAGAVKSFDIDNVNRVRMVAVNSGDTISWLGVAQV